MQLIHYLVLGAWIGPALAVGALLTVAAVTGERIDPSEWRRCAGHDPNNPAEKQCWVRIDDGAYCPRHDGSGRQVNYT